MKYLGAYMLAVLGGNSSPDADAIKKILSSAGVEYEEDILSKVLSELEGKDVMQVIAEGKSKLSSVPSGGAAGGGGAAAGGAGEAPAEEEAKEEEKEESEEEEEEMDFDLFD